MVFLKGMLQKIGFREIVDEDVDLPKAKSNRGCKASTILKSFISNIWCGANRFLHTELTRHDAVLGDIFDWKLTHGQDTHKPFFLKFDQLEN